MPRRGPNGSFVQQSQRDVHSDEENELRMMEDGAASCASEDEGAGEEEEEDLDGEVDDEEDADDADGSTRPTCSGPRGDSAGSSADDPTHRLGSRSPIHM